MAVSEVMPYPLIKQGFEGKFWYPQINKFSIFASLGKSFDCH